MILAIVIAVVLIALAFDVTNGFHDAATAIATSVSTRALTPRIALVLAAVMNFAGALLGQEVAHTVKDTIALDSGQARHALVIVLAALVGAIAWNLITWHFGMPSSSTHALIGALVGSALAAGRSIAMVHWHTVLSRVVLPMVLSPAIGLVLAFLVMSLIMWSFRRSSPQPMHRGFRAAQTISAAALALGHGLQDAQKTMGVIFLALSVAYPLSYGGDRLPVWVVLCAAAAMSLGTYAGGFRIMRTLGRRIIFLDPARGFSAEAVGASVLYTTAFIFRAPISTTQVITSAIMGAGATRRLSAVRWGVARSIALAWLLTMPGAGLVAAAAYELLRPLI